MQEFELVWRIIKKSAIDLWDEMLYLLLFNVIWLVGTVLVIPMPFVTFGLFYIARDVGQAKGIKLGHFFAYGRQALKPAYIWGGVNAVAFALLFFNIYFYSGFQAGWASMLQLLFVSMTGLWIIMQLITLPFYPRLVDPSFKLALRNAAVIVGKYPGVTILLSIFLAILFVLTVFFWIFVLLLTFSFFAIVANNMVDILVKREMKDVEQ